MMIFLFVFIIAVNLADIRALSVVGDSENEGKSKNWHKIFGYFVRSSEISNLLEKIYFKLNKTKTDITVNDYKDLIFSPALPSQHTICKSLKL